MTRSYIADPDQYTLVNCTPHDIVVFDSQGEHELMFLPGVERAPRVRQRYEPWLTIPVDSGDVEVQDMFFGEVRGLPEPHPGTLYIVSLFCAFTAKTHRDDLIYPSGAVYDSSGRVIGCRRFARPA